MCERSKTPIEIIPMDEYYLKVVDVKEKLENIAKELHFHPEMHRTILQNWIEVARNWPISRRRFYGTEVPVWYCSKCREPFLPPEGPYYQPWRDPPPGNPVCEKCGSMEFVGDIRTFDTWMDSSVSALYVTKYRRDENFHEKTYPATIQASGEGHYPDMAPLQHPEMHPDNRACPLERRLDYRLGARRKRRED